MTGPAEMATAYVAPNQSTLVVTPHDDRAHVGVTTTEGSGWAQQVMVAPTQVRRPWRTTIRSGVQFLLAFATLAPFIAGGVYQDADAYPAVVAQVLVAGATLTRVMALPQVEKFLQDWAPWLAAAPAAISRKDRKAGA